MVHSFFASVCGIGLARKLSNSFSLFIPFYRGSGVGQEVFVSSLVQREGRGESVAEVETRIPTLTEILMSPFFF